MIFLLVGNRFYPSMWRVDRCLST